jgi:hypothetical protein
MSVILPPEQRRAACRIAELVAEHFGNPPPGFDRSGIVEIIHASARTVSIKTFSSAGDFKITIRKEQ